MNNVRLSINLSKIEGTRVINMSNDKGQKEVYVAIPARALFVPSENPQPFLMATMIHCPDSKWSQFMLKPYMSPEDYKMLTDEQRKSIPIIGSGTFMENRQSAELYRQSIDVTAESATLAPTNPTHGAQPTYEPAAALPQSSSSPEGGIFPPAEKPNEFYVLDKGAWVGAFESFDQAVAYSEQDQVNRPTIECWQGDQRRGRWNYDPTNFSWKQAL